MIVSDTRTIGEGQGIVEDLMNGRGENSEKEEPTLSALVLILS
jgi:hypothetical protein